MKYKTLCEIKSIEEYKNPNGIWKITTEGNAEGRISKNLGIFKGYLPDILRMLKDKCYYNFFVKKLEIFEEDTTGSSVDELKVYIEFPYDFTNEERMECTKFLFPGSYVDNHGSGSWCGVTVYYNDLAKKKADEEEKKKIAKAMSKLTKEEMKLLGIIDRR